MTYAISLNIATRNEAGQMRGIGRDKLCEGSQKALAREREKLAVLAERIAKMEAAAAAKSAKEMAKAVAIAEGVKRVGRPIGFKCDPETVRKMVEGRRATLAARKAAHAPQMGA